MQAVNQADVHRATRWRFRLRADRPHGDRHPGRSWHPDVVAIDLSQRARAGEAVGAGHAARPRRGTTCGQSWRASRHHAVHVRPDAGDRRLHRSSGSDRVHRRHPRTRPGRRPVIACSPALPPVPTNYVQVLMKQFTIRGSSSTRRGSKTPSNCLTARPLRPRHPHAAARGVRRGLALLEGIQGLREGHDHDGRGTMTNRLHVRLRRYSVLVTGGTSGIGYAIASAFAAAGAT